VEKFDVPILMYHYIRVAPENDQLGANLSVSPENFAAHMKWLYDDNYRTIKLADLADPNRQTISRIYFEKKKPIVLTFDDGYEDAYTAAFPVLKKYSFSGTFFIIKDYVGRENRLNDAQIAEMEKAGMEFGSHTLTHPDLTKISLDEAHSQIFDSKGEWSVFCYPSGKYNSDVINLVKEAGYVAAVTTKIGIANENSNLFELRRVRVENVPPQELRDKISYAYENGS
jgi:peptidoglycan/xylan/chitin deacetylase (PgdA/CDA1 family)